MAYDRQVDTNKPAIAWAEDCCLKVEVMVELAGILL